jgi:undecaprenyl phosphate-alpha-L-ara4N flippase subunit ArnE
MNATLAPAALALLVFCIVAETAQQVSFKAGADRARTGRGYALAVVRQPLVWAGIWLWVLESIAWVLVLRRTPLSLAYPVMTLTYAAVPLAGVLWLRERMSVLQWAGAGLILAGVACVGLSGL